MNLINRFLPLSFLMIVAFFGIRASQNDSASIDALPSSRTPLVVYGEQIFIRENCLDCHTLRDENETTERNSLDGYVGRRSALWLYMLLTDPSEVSLYKHSTHEVLTQKKNQQSTFERHPPEKLRLFKQSKGTLLRSTQSPSRLYYSKH